MENFNELKTSYLAIKFQGKELAESGEFEGPKTVKFGVLGPYRLQSGEFQGPERTKPNPFEISSSYLCNSNQ